MSSKGGRTTIKRLALPRTRSELKKTSSWAIRPKPGPHPLDRSIPLGTLLRDGLRVSGNAKETRRILESGHVLVNGQPRKSRQFGVGLFDVVMLAEGKAYFRMILDSKGRLTAIPIEKPEAHFSVQKVVAKKTLKGKRFQLTTNAGFTFVEKTPKIRPGWSLKIDLEKMEIVDSFEMKKGNAAYIIGGTHTGTVAMIESVAEATMMKPALVSLSADEPFQTVAKNVLVIGEKKPVISVSEKEKG